MQTPDDVERLARDAILDAWLACAPPQLADEYLRGHGQVRG